MANINPVITALTKYVEEHNLPLLAKSILGAKSASLFTLQSGVKGASALNIMNTDVAFGDGSVCGWAETDGTEFSQRILDAKPLKVNMAFCDKKLLSTWANYEVSVAAGQKNMPFEEEWTAQIVDNVKAEVEKMIYQGESGSTNEFEGLLSIMGADASVVKVNKASGTSVYETIKEVYATMKDEVATKDDAVILVSGGTFRKFIQELVSANLYHFAPDDEFGEYRLPGTALKVIAVDGLNGADADYVIGARLSNLFYGTDLQGDEEKFELWYSQDNREFRLAIEFVAGVQYAFGEEIVLGKIAKS